MFDATTLSQAELARRIQFTQVSPNATYEMIVTHLETCALYRFDAAMIPMCWVPLARDVLSGTGVKVATCIGLGVGQESVHGKVALIRECLALGADEIDYEPNMAFFLSGMYDDFRAEAAQVVRAAAGRPVKAMLELGYLPAERDKRFAARLLDEAGVPWIKNSSGWGPAGIPATPEDIRLLRDSVSPACKIKASGKVNSYEKAVALLNAGAELIGTSSGPHILEGMEGSAHAY